MVLRQGTLLNSMLEEVLFSFPDKNVMKNIAVKEPGLRKKRLKGQVFTPDKAFHFSELCFSNL